VLKKEKKMSELQSIHCVPCEGGVTPLTREEANKLLDQTPEWDINDQATAISRHFSFKNFYYTMAFVNATAWVAHQENHHPDMEVGYNYCTLRYSTHAIRGLSKNDFICAAKINLLCKES
jgi:4a-hydroxytetrahydrobiopterin dehydratase